MTRIGLALIPLGQHRHRMKPLLAGVRTGLIAGFGLSLLLLGIGAVRLVFALVFGGKVQAPTADDARAVAYYVGGIAAAGALVGFLLAALPNRPSARGVAFAIGGFVGTLLISIGLLNPGKSLEPTDWWIAAIVGPIFGLAVWRGIDGDEPNAPTASNPGAGSLRAPEGRGHDSNDPMPPTSIES